MTITVMAMTLKCIKMKFYDRQNEIKLLREIESQSAEAARMTIVTGRRRVGKTTLLKQAFTQTPMLYLFVSKKNEALLCEEFTKEVTEKLRVPLGIFTRFADLFRALMQLSENNNFTLIIDEFQEFMNINNTVFSDMQNIWDSEKEKSRINLVLCGSVYSMMKQIFENAKEPLFGRATNRLVVNPFSVKTLKEILNDHFPAYSNEDLLAFYMITGGVAKYVEQLLSRKAYTKEKIINTIFMQDSYFLDEGRVVLIDEFGKDYGNYFSILSLIASSKTDRGAMESILNISAGGYLDRLEKDFRIIRRKRPFLAKEGSRNNIYLIEDNFLNFWFRFIYKYRSAVEISNLDYVKNIVVRDYETYSGIILEKYFRTKLTESMQYSDIQGYWDNKGGNEIDIIAVNEFEKRLDFYEVKRNPSKINLNLLKAKATAICSAFPEFKCNFTGLSPEDM